MQHLFTFPEWLPSWVPLVLLLPTLLWGLSFLFMPFSVFGVKSRLEVIEQRLDEIQNEIRHVALRLPPAGTPSTDYDDVYPPRMAEPRANDRVIMSRPPIPPARHELFNAQEAEPPGEPELEDRPPPPPNARPARRGEPLTRPAARSEPRLDWRR